LESTNSPSPSLPLDLSLPPDGPRTSRRSRWIVWVGGLVLAIVVGTLLTPTLSRLLPLTEVENTPVIVTPVTDDAPDWIAALGHLEPKGGIVAVAPPRAARDAIVTALLVTEGQVVAAGDPLATLETLARARAELAQAEAEVSLRAAELARARRAIAADKADTAAQVASATARLAGAERDLSRAVQLVANNALSAAREEELRTERDALVAEQARAEAQEMRLQGPIDTHPDVLAAEAALAAAQAARDLAALAVADATVRALAAGRIIAIPARVGEPAPAEGVVRLAVAGPVVALLEVHQDRIHHVATDARVTLRAPALDGELAGHVTRIGREVQRQAVFEADPAANTDARVFLVEVTLDPASSAIEADLLNLQVLARIEAGDPT